MLKIRQIKFILLKIITLSALFSLGGCMHFFQADAQPPQIEGIFWQPDLATTPPSGNWNLLGVSTFVPQWSTVQSKAWFDHDMGFEKWDKTLNLKQLNQQPWSQHIILGLAGEYDEKLARSNVLQLAENSKQIIEKTKSIPLKGYYFPVEADPTWLGVGVLAQALATLPQPVWVSIYSAEQSPEHLDSWLKSWLPHNANVFFQDGVGVGTRSPQQAKTILEDLQKEFGKDKVVIVLEAFRPVKAGQFRSAYPWEVIEQLKAYEGQKVYIFDGPHYMNRITVYAVALWYKLKYGSTT
ncbi:alpha-amylase family protein [Acinetobacter vivianii]|uniref:hypothetical protein n=1 Tax=Acinetobacter vivianii TaxID=1776742 RepID=UPI002DB649F0|nr:hypothetical protein [Acinetobacter vivianii]MEB6480529.1 hypothetical protein [Acinetobacter vivianii]MEB6656438.1 hypothetical protein [Acinetobacter vivianii]